MINALYFVWNPQEGFEIGSLTIRYYSLMFIVAFSLGWFIMRGIFRREGLSDEKLDNIFVYSIIGILLGARLGDVFFYNWNYYKNHLIEILLPIKAHPDGNLFGLIKGWEFTGFTGLASHGAAIAMIVAMYIMYRKKIIEKPLLWILDRVVIPVASGAVFVRLGNFFNSEILGKETGTTYGVKFVRDAYSPFEASSQTNITNSKEAYQAIASDPKFSHLLNKVAPKHPAQLYESAAYVIVFAILFYLYWKTDARNKQGLLFGVFLVLLWTVRFFVEFVKESQGGFEENLGYLSTGQWLSIPFMILGFYFIFRPKQVA